MKKALIVGLVLAMCLFALVSCAPKPAPPTPPPTTPDAKVTEAPPPATPPAGGELKNEVEYLAGVTLMFSDKDKPVEADMKAVEDAKVPEGTKAIVVKVAKDPKFPADKEIEITFVSMDGKNVMATGTFKTKDATEKDVVVTLVKAAGFDKGEGKVVLKEKDSGKMVEKAITVGEAGEKKMEEPKEGEKKMEEPKEAPKPEAPKEGEKKEKGEGM